MFKRLSCLALAFACSTAALSAAEGAPSGGLLPYWEIGLSGFSADAPFPIQLPKRTGEADVYWVWPFRITATSNLDLLEKELEASMPKLQGVDAKEYLESYRKRINEVNKEPRKLRLFAALHTDTGQILTDTSNPAVRNLAERKLKREMITTAELAGRELKPGETVSAIAIFPRLDAPARQFEIRLYGLGRRALADYTPEGLAGTDPKAALGLIAAATGGGRRFTPLYHPGELLSLENRFDATLRRALRFSYHRRGATNEMLDPVESIESRSDWVWLWPTQIFAGRARILTIERDTGLTDDAQTPLVLKREYRYIPYKLWNNTARPQSLQILKAGVCVDVVWRGEKIALVFPDCGEADDNWKTQVFAKIRENAAGEAEKKFVLENEKMQKDVVFAEGEPAHADLAADLAAKADILPEGGRHFSGTLAPAQQVKGLVIVRWAVADIKAVAADLVASLRAQAITAAEGQEGTPLLQAYQGMRAKADAPGLRPPEPEVDEVALKLAALAAEDLQAQFADKAAIPSEDERLYGKLAPLGRLLSLLAAAEAEKRATEKATTDLAFEVKWDGVIDRCSFPSNFRRILPVAENPMLRLKPIKPYQRTELDESKKAGKKSAPAPKAEESAPAEEKPAEEKPAEEKPAE